MKYKIIDGIVTVIAIVAIVFAMMALWTVLTTEKGEAPKLLGCSVLRVVTGSMEPEIPQGSVVVSKETDPEELQVGDVISYYSRDPVIKGQINTHRISEIDESGAETLYVTKGDANNLNDFYAVHKEDILGKVVLCSTLLGQFVKIATSKVGFFLIVILPLLFIIIYNLRDIVRTIRKEAQADYEQERENEDDHK